MPAPEQLDLNEGDNLALSFLDVLSCGLGSTIALFLILSVLPHVGSDKPGASAVAGSAEELRNAGARLRSNRNVAKNALVTITIVLQGCPDDAELVAKGITLSPTQPAPRFIRRELVDPAQRIRFQLRLSGRRKAKPIVILYHGTPASLNGSVSVSVGANQSVQMDGQADADNPQDESLTDVSVKEDTVLATIDLSKPKWISHGN